MKDLLKKYKLLNHSLSIEEERALFMEYVFQTNKLEGNKLTLAQTTSIIDGGFVSGKNVSIKDVYEQKGTYKALVRMIKAVNDKEALSIKLISELNWLTLSYLWNDDFYLSAKNKGQKYGDFKCSENRIQIVYPGGRTEFIQPLSSPQDVKLNLDMLLDKLIFRIKM